MSDLHPNHKSRTRRQGRARLAVALLERAGKGIDPGTLWFDSSGVLLGWDAGENGFQFFSEILRLAASDLLADGFAVRPKELNVGNAGDAKFFLRFGIIPVIRIQIGPDELVMEGLDGIARVNTLFHGLAGAAPGGGKDDDGGFTGFFLLIEQLPVGGDEFGAALREFTGGSGERQSADGGEREGKEGSRFHDGRGALGWIDRVMD